MSIYVVDTTLRDGEQKAGIALGLKDKIEIAKILSHMEIYQIEAGIPAMGGTEKRSISEMVGLGLKSKISSWNRISIEDINHSIDCRVDIIHVSAPTSELQIKSKLGKDKTWVIENLKKCAYYSINKGYETTIGLEDASRADIDFLTEICKEVYKLGIKRVRYADTVGILYPRKIYNDIKKIREKVPIDIEIHSHNDFGMAISNSVAAIEGGAKFVDCTISGIGERAGNCNYVNFFKVFNKLSNNKIGFEDVDNLAKLERNIKDIIKYGKI